MSRRMEDKVAIVTGAAPCGDGVGNGMAVAIRFAREGAKVVLVNRSQARADQLAEQIRAEGGVAAAFAADMTVPESAKATVEFTVATFGAVHVLHNNIGGLGPGTPETCELDGFERALSSNLSASFLASKYAIPEMRRAGGGSIVMVSSLAGEVGLIGTGGMVGYATAKAGLHGLTRSIAADYATQNIRCNCLMIGPVFTPLVAGLGYDREGRRKMIPTRTEGTAWDVAHAAVYLASDESRWVTGIVLPIDGGLLHLREWPR